MRYNDDDDDDEDNQLPAAVLNTVPNISEQDVIKFLHKHLHAGKRLLICTSKQHSTYWQTASEGSESGQGQISKFNLIFNI